MEWMPQAIREGIFTILFISGPLVVLAAGLGLSVGIIQAATQVQEQTLGSAVKIIGLFIAIIIFGFYMFGYMRNYASDNINRAFKLVPRLGSYIMPRKNFLEVTADEEVLNPLEAPTSLQSPPPKNSKAPTMADELAIPDIEVRGKESMEGQLGLPQMQRKEIGDPNILKQDRDGSPVQEQEIEPIQETTTITPVQPTVEPNTNPVVSPRREEVVEEVIPAAIPNLTTPAEEPERKRPRRSLTDSLSRLRESIDEFNETNELEEAGI